MLSLCRGIEVIVEAQLGSFKVIMLAWKVYVAQALSVGYAMLQRCTRLDIEVFNSRRFSL